MKKRRAGKRIIGLQKPDQLLLNRENAYLKLANVLEIRNYHRRDIDMV